MNTKPKISADGTYVFDAEDIEQLDELSLTSVVRGMVDPAEQPDAEPTALDTISASSAGDTTINKLLNGATSPVDQPASRVDRSFKPEPPETTGDLLDPDLMFRKLPPRQR